MTVLIQRISYLIGDYNNTPHSMYPIIGLYCGQFRTQMPGCRLILHFERWAVIVGDAYIINYYIIAI